jgi:hypothetical protein
VNILKYLETRGVNIGSSPLGANVTPGGKILTKKLPFVQPFVDIQFEVEAICICTYKRKMLFHAVFMKTDPYFVLENVINMYLSSAISSYAILIATYIGILFESFIVLPCANCCSSGN